MKIVDLKDSPYKDSIAKNGFDSVSKGRVVLLPTNGKMYPTCIYHGAMNKMDASGLWRCPTCNSGCYQMINDTLK